MKKITLTIAIVAIMLMMATSIFAEEINRVVTYTEDDSLVVHYNTSDPQMNTLFVTKGGSLVGPKERLTENPPVYKLQSVTDAVLYLDKKWTYVYLNEDGAWSKVKMPGVGTHDFTWKFTIRYERAGTIITEEAYSLVDRFSNYSIVTTGRDRNMHFELEITPQGFPMARGNMRK